MHRNIVTPYINQSPVAACKDASMPEFSKEMVALVDSIVNAFAKYNPDTLSYELNYEDLSDLSREEIVSQLFADDESIAIEASGPDNDSFEKVMLPTLINFLKNSTSADTRMDFLEAWKLGLSTYAENKISNLLSWRVQQYNFDVGYDARGLSANH